MDKIEEFLRKKIAEGNASTGLPFVANRMAEDKADRNSQIWKKAQDSVPTPNIVTPSAPVASPTPTAPPIAGMDNNALYDYYKNRYVDQGKKAMEDTMGRAMAATGGYANSYAQSVGQQAYNEQLGTFNDAVMQAAIKYAQSQGGSSGSSASLKTPTESLMQKALEAYKENGDKGIDEFEAMNPGYNWEPVYEYLDKYGELPDEYKAYTKTKDTKNGFFGVDRNDVVEDEKGNKYKIKDLPESIQRQLTALAKGETFQLGQEKDDWLPIKDRTFKKIDTTWNIAGIDNNGRVQDEYGNVYTLKELKDKYGFSKDVLMRLTGLKEGETYNNH